jgi:hypothetical protein
MALPIRTGMTLLSSTSLIVRGTFKRSTAGMMKRLATECSRPIATKVDMGNQMPMSLPTRLLDAPARKTARLTIQLHEIALTMVCPRVPWHLLRAVDVQRLAVLGLLRPVYRAATAKRLQPMTLPMMEMIKLFASSLHITISLYLAAVTAVTELPVKSCKGGEEKKETSQNLYIQIKS